MTTSAPTLTLNNTTDAFFRAWGSGISAALAAIGLVQTADTGQINWSTVTRPLADLTAQGYEIWRFNDALQSTRPIFIKIEYGAGAATGTAVSAALWITVGTSSNGAGTITGPAIAARRLIGCNTSVAHSVVTVQCFFASNGGYLTLVMPHTTTGFALVLSIARTCDANGADNSDAIQVMSYNNQPGPVVTQTNEAFNFLAGTALGSVAYTVFAVPAGHFGTASVGADTYFFPRVLNIPKQEYDNGLMGAFTADVVDLTPVTVPNNGSNHVYLPYTIGGITFLWRYE